MVPQCVTEPFLPTSEPDPRDRSQAGCSHSNAKPRRTLDSSGPGREDLGGCFCCQPADADRHLRVLSSHSHNDAHDRYGPVSLEFFSNNCAHSGNKACACMRVCVACVVCVHACVFRMCLCMRVCSVCVCMCVCMRACACLSACVRVTDCKESFVNKRKALTNKPFVTQTCTASTEVSNPLVICVYWLQYS